MNELILVNKTNKLDQDFKPVNLIKINEYSDTYKHIYLDETTYKYALKFLRAASKKLGKKVIIESGYRDYYYQTKIFNKELEKKTKEEVMKTVALPGESEHQTGLAIDIGFIIKGENVFNFDVNKYVSEYTWLEENAYKYGFILRYPKGKEKITGYNYEPWHFRYVGVKYAKAIFKQNLTLEEYLKYDIVN